MIHSFHGTFRFLSNFHPCKIVYEGVEYPSVEHAYVASKTTDLAIRTTIQAVKTAGQVKRAGRKLQLRADWNGVRLPNMELFLRQKFSTPDLRELLLETLPEELVEGNHWHDNYFGSCSCEKCNNQGQNNLGKLLMKIRQEIYDNLSNHESNKQ